MAAQRKNLLEAFKNAGDLPEPKQRPVAQPKTQAPTPSLFETLKKKRDAAKAGRSATSKSPGSAKPEKTRSRRSSTPETSGTSATSGEPKSRTSRIQMPSLSILSGDIPPGLLLAAGAGVVLAVGVAIGRASRPEVEASGPNDPASLAELMGDTPHGGGGGIVPAGSGTRAGSPGSSGADNARNMGVRGTRDTLDAGGRTKIEDSPLFDSANHYTIVVQTYSHSNSDHAWATFEHLRSEGFSVFPPVVKDEYLLILVGAAPSSKDLAVVLERLLKMQRDGDYAYHDAYRVPIDNYIER